MLVCTGIATFESIEDMRPYWHPFVTVQACGLAIAYCVNVARPWDGPRPILRLAIAVAIGAILGHALMVPIKNFILEQLLNQPRLYTLDYVLSHKKTFFFSTFSAFLIGLCISVFFLLRFREARAAEALHKAEAERLLLSKHAMESELKLMQAQIEPHFLFNTLASVQYLTETDPPQATRLLGHLLSYLRAALPQMRSASATLGQEIEFAEAYLNILRMRMGPRLDFSIDVPDSLRTHPFPPVLLISVVENAVTHGLEPLAAGGHVTISARQEGDRVLVTVTDTGIGLSGVSPAGSRCRPHQRPRAAGGAVRRARAILARRCDAPRGARATIEIPARDRGAARRRRERDCVTMTTALIAEDEPMMRAQLKGRLAQAWPELEIVGEAGNGEEALALADEKRPDIAFLDIRMPVLSGLDVARELGGTLPCRLRHRVRRLRGRGVRRRRRRLRAEAADARAHREGRRTAQGARRAPPLDLTALLAKLAAQEPSSGPLKWIRASLGASMKMIAVDDVIYFRAEDKYTKVVTAEGEALIRKPIKELFEELDPESVLADPPQRHREPARDRARRPRLARRTRDRAQGTRRDARCQPDVCASVQGDVASAGVPTPPLRLRPCAR